MKGFVEPEKTGMSVRPMEVRRERALEVTLGMEALPWTVEIWVFLAAVLGRRKGVCLPLGVPALDVPQQE